MKSNFSRFLRPDNLTELVLFSYTVFFSAILTKTYFGLLIWFCIALPINYFCMKINKNSTLTQKIKFISILTLLILGLLLYYVIGINLLNLQTKFDKQDTNSIEFEQFITSAEEKQEALNNLLIAFEGDDINKINRALDTYIIANQKTIDSMEKYCSSGDYSKNIKEKCNMLGLFRNCSNLDIQIMKKLSELKNPELSYKDCKKITTQLGNYSNNRECSEIPDFGISNSDLETIDEQCDMIKNE